MGLMDTIKSWFGSAKGAADDAAGNGGWRGR